MLVDCTCPHGRGSPTEVTQLIVEDDARPWRVDASSEPTKRNTAD